MSLRLGATGSLIAGATAAIAASVCCVGPLVLVTLGVGGAWMAQLTEFEAVRPLFIGLVLAFLGLAFHRLHFAPQVCAAGTLCANPLTLKRQRVAFWIATVLLIALIAAPWAAPLFY